MSIIIDKEFESLIPPLTVEEYTQLEKNIVHEGIRDALIVWPQGNGNSILIDGHNRMRISVAHAGIRFQTKEMPFKDRDEAKRWIILNQFGRRNLSAYDRSILALKLKPVIAEKAKKNQGTRTDICQKSDKSIDTKKELAQIAGVSHDTIHKVEAIANSKDEKLKQQVRSGDVSINQAYRAVKGIEDKHPAKTMQEFVEKKKEEHQDFKDKKTVSISEIKADKGTRRFLAINIYTKLIRMGKQITEVSLEIADGDIDLEESAAEFTEEERVNLITAMGKWTAQLKAIMEVIDT